MFLFLFLMCMFIVLCRVLNITKWSTNTHNSSASEYLTPQVHLVRSVCVSNLIFLLRSNVGRAWDECRALSGIRWWCWIGCSVYGSMSLPYLSVFLCKETIWKNFLPNCLGRGWIIKLILRYIHSVQKSQN